VRFNTQHEIQSARGTARVDFFCAALGAAIDCHRHSNADDEVADVIAAHNQEQGRDVQLLRVGPSSSAAWLRRTVKELVATRRGGATVEDPQPSIACTWGSRKRKRPEALRAFFDAEFPEWTAADLAKMDRDARAHDATQ
jgi:hypothetical protein